MTDNNNILEMIKRCDIFDEIEKMVETTYNLKITKEQFLKDTRCIDSFYLSIIVNNIILKMSKCITMSDRFEIIKKFLAPDNVQKKKNGEVFTPLSLVNDMLDQLPEHVWSDKNLKWPSRLRDDSRPLF